MIMSRNGRRWIGCQKYLGVLLVFGVERDSTNLSCVFQDHAFPISFQGRSRIFASMTLFSDACILVFSMLSSTLIQTIKNHDHLNRLAFLARLFDGRIKATHNYIYSIHL